MVNVNNPPNAPPNPPGNPPPNPPANPPQGPGVGPLPQGPTWRIIVGAVFGALVLVGFFYFALRGATEGPEFACNGFFPLAVFFALGTALAGAFIGGEVGVRGTLPIGEFGYAAIGGIAGLIVIFIITYFTYDQFCGNRDSALRLDIQGLPESFVAAELPRDFWVQKRSDDSLLIMFNNKPPKQLKSYLLLKFANARECKIDILEYIHNTMASASRATDQDRFAVENWKNTNKSIIIDFNDDYVSKTEAVRFGIPNCLISWSQPNSAGYPIENKIESDGVILSVTKTQRSVVSTPDKPNAVPTVPSPLPIDEDQESAVDPQTKAGTPAFFFGEMIGVRRAFAQDDQFELILAKLVGADEVEARKAEQVLVTDREKYRHRIMLKLRDVQSPDRIKMALVDAVVAIVNADQPSIKPGNGIRDLSSPIKLFDDQDYDNLVSYSSASDATLRFQARRMIQRFPVDRFEQALKGVQQGAIFATTCDLAIDVGLKYFRYAALLYYYNRIADKFYSEKGLSEADENDIDRAYSSGYNASSCLSPELKIDSALLDYAKALISINIAYNKSSGRGAVDQSAIASAQEFTKKVKASKDNYVYPQHIAYMSMYHQGVKWSEITKGASRIQKAKIGSAAGLTNGDEFRRAILLGEDEEIKYWNSPFAQAESGKLNAGDISAVLAEIPSLTFVKYKDGDAWSFGWVASKKN